MLSSTTKENEFTIHPFIHSFSHHLSRANHLRSVTIPDVHPGILLLSQSPNSFDNVPRNPYSSLPPAPPAPLPPDNRPDGDANGGGDGEGVPPSFSLPANRFSMIAGDFLQCYSPSPSADASFDAVATVFFIDTAPNVVSYIETIHRVLRPGGVWVNLGPLLWHWEGRAVPERGRGGGGEDADTNADADADGEDGEPLGIEGMGAVELTLEEVMAVVEEVGFRIESRGGGDGGEEVGEVRTGYIQDERSMLNYEFKAQFWVAVKK